MLPLPLDEYSFESLSHLWWECGCTTRRTIHVDVDEVPLGCAGVLFVSVQAYLVANAPVSKPGDPQTSVYGVREGDRLEEPALSFYHESYDRALLDI